MGLSGIDATYFAEGREATANREQLAMAVQEMMYEWLQISDGSVCSALHSVFILLSVLWSGLSLGKVELQSLMPRTPQSREGNNYVRGQERRKSVCYSLSQYAMIR
jgi:hypothetical protein